MAQVSLPTSGVQLPGLRDPSGLHTPCHTDGTAILDTHASRLYTGRSPSVTAQGWGSELRPLHMAANHLHRAPHPAPLSAR